MKSFISNLKNKFYFRSSVRMKVWRNFYRPLNFNISLRDVIQETVTRERKKKDSNILPVLEDIQNNFTNNGNSFSKAVQKHVSSNEFILFLAGEKETRALPQAFSLVVDFLTTMKNIKDNFIMQMTYPFFLFFLICLLIWSFGSVIVPQLASASDPSTWTGAGAAIYLLSKFTASPFFLVLLFGIVVGIFFLFVSFTQLTGPIRLYLDKLPPYTWYKSITGAIFIYTLSILVKTGMTVNDALLELSRKKDLSPYLLERIIAISNKYKEGNYLSEVINNTGLNFPSKELVEEIETFEKYTPNLHESLYELGQEWLLDAEKNLYSKITVIKFLMFGIVFMLILLMVAGFFSVQGSMLQAVN